MRNRRLEATVRHSAKVLAAIALFASVAAAQVPEATPLRRLPDRVVQTLDDALARAEAERQRIERERWDREAAAERNRVHSYYVTCRVSEIVARAEHLTIFCLEARDVLNSSTGAVYARDSIGSQSYVAVFVDPTANPALAAMAAEIATASFTNRMRLHLKAVTHAGEGPQMWLTELRLHRGEGCTPACPP
jgi:hypothetical protein